MTMIEHPATTTSQPEKQLGPWVVWVISLLFGVVTILASALLATGTLSHMLEAIGAALIGGCVAVRMIELRFHDRLIQRVVGELSNLLQQQHTDLLNGFKLSMNAQVDKLETLVSSRSDEVLPMALQQLFDGTSPDAKLQFRTGNITNAVKKLKANRSWTDDVSLRLIGELLFQVSENAVSIASAREGGAHHIVLPPSSSSLASKILATQMRLMEEGDEYIVLSDLSSWKDGLTDFFRATVDAVAHGVNVRRLVCPFDHDEDMDEDAVRRIMKLHLEASNESQKNKDGLPFYQFAAVRRSAAKHYQLHHIGIFRRGKEGIKFEPYQPDLSDIRFERTRDDEPENMKELWSQAQHSFKRTATGYELVEFDDLWTSLGANWWK